MKVYADEIISNPTDYKVCKKCNHVNWYENEVCVWCNDKSFTRSKKIIIRQAKDFLSISLTYHYLKMYV